RIYGENTKSYTVGEKVILYYFSYSGKDFVLEKESSGTQKEVGIYQRKHVNLNKYKKINVDNVNYIDNDIYNIIIFFILPIILSTLFVSFCLNFFIVQKRYLDADLNNGIYKINFNNTNKLKLFDGQITHTYDGKQDKFKEIKGIKFSIKTEKDRQILNEFKKNINKIKSFDNINYILGNNLGKNIGNNDIGNNNTSNNNIGSINTIFKKTNEELNSKKLDNIIGNIHIGNKKYEYSEDILKKYLIDNIKIYNK
ncbi:hypothetical protein, partial [Candidatus Vampirococcus lugosii]|nr:hypothetical protein [Candidatus Vampirococcus lugosii]